MDRRDLILRRVLLQNVAHASISSNDCPSDSGCVVRRSNLPAPKNVTEKHSPPLPPTAPVYSPYAKA
jgi:hypothetical protein